MYQRTDGWTHVAGFLSGFFFGCCGIALAALWRKEYLPSAVLGLVSRFVLGLVIGFVVNVDEMIRSPSQVWVRDVPWQLVAAFVIVVVFVLGLIGGAIWAFGPRGDEDEDEPPRPPEPREYVTYTRR